MEKINRPRGTVDVLPSQIPVWRRMEETARGLCRHFHVQELRTPIFEHTELFMRGVGDTTDIVEKEMYTFNDKGGRSITLRPEGTAGMARAILENKLYAEPLPLKLSYIGPMFRYERPGAGRVRQHHQFGIEVVGSESPAVDVEVASMAMRFYEEIGATDLTLVVNSVGCPTCRPQYRQRMLDYLQPRLVHMCEDCNRRAERNPLRILDCKQSACQAELVGAPSVLDCLCGECRTHFDKVVRGLQTLGIPVEVDASLVRGLDYYTRTVFEIMHGPAGSRTTVSGGGRYNGLFAQLGGPDLSGVGFGAGLERAILLLEQCGVTVEEAKGGIDAFVIPLGEDAEFACLPLIDTLRRQGLAVERDFAGSGLKSALKRASRLGARYALLLGEAELATGQVQVKDLVNGTQENLTPEQFINSLER
ncbi:MAG: histidine--tRNA ligase [Tumebacillaceae bacterium]